MYGGQGGATAQNGKHQQLLRDLKSTVEGLLVSQVANVWYIYGGLNRLHNDVEKIFRNGCKISSENSTSDYWQFIQGLEWLQPDTSKSMLTVDCEYKKHIPHHIKNDKGSIWLYRSLESHSLSQKLSWLLSDQTHLLSCYQSQAYLCQEKYTEAMMVCLRAVERNQPSLMSEIDPSLFLSKTSARDYHKVHRRCSSFPDAHLKLMNQSGGSQSKGNQSFGGNRSKTMYNMKTSVSEDDEEVLRNKRSKKHIVQGKLKAWNSMPNLGIKGIKIRDRSKSATQSRTTPSTPVHNRLDCERAIDCLDPTTNIEQSIERTSPKPEDIPMQQVPTKTKVTKHVIINNQDIIEHAPPCPSINVVKEDLSTSLPSDSKSAYSEYSKSPTYLHPKSSNNNSPYPTSSNNSPYSISSNNKPSILSSNNKPSILSSNNKPSILSSNNKPPYTLSSNNKSPYTLSPNIKSPNTKSPNTKSPGSKSPFKLIASKSAPDYSFLDSFSGVSGQKDYKRQPKKSFIEDGGMSVLPMSTGYFPRPVKGQTLTAFLQSSQFARANAELDRENAHFSISEAMIAAMEQIRCRRDLKLADEQAEESDEEIMSLKQRIRLRRRQKLEEKQRRMWGVIGDANIETSTTGPSTSPFSSSTGTASESVSSEEIDDLEIDEASNLVDNRGLSMSMASLYSEADLLKRPRGAPDGASDILSAEGVALSLISRFNEKHLPRASELTWLVSEEDAPQALLPMPKSWPVSPDETEEIPVTPLRGTKEWAPPRPQIIFTLHPTPVKKEALLKQNYRCAGCGFRVDKKYSSTFRYCNYLGRFFCTQCHANQLALIPARVLQKWDFTRYAVSSFSYRLLEQMYRDPLFRVFDLNKNIGRRSRNLQLCKNYRQGLFLMKDYVQTCRYAENTLEFLKNEPSYVYCDPEMYSIQDLVDIRSGEMKNKLRYLVEICGRHTSECELCSARGFICEICKEDTILFPWQLKSVKRCLLCGTCFHSACWDPMEKPCLRCQRITKRREIIIPQQTTSQPLTNTIS